MRKAPAAVAAFACVSAIVGCGGAVSSGLAGAGVQPSSGTSATATSSPTAADVTPSAVSTAQYDGAVTQEVNYPGINIDLLPPAPGVAPATSWERAANLCVTPNQRVVCGDYQVAPHVNLATVTTDDGAKINADGSLTPTIDHELMYVLTWVQPCGAPVAGPEVPSGVSPPSAVGKTCTFLTLIDATSGQYVLAAGHSM